MHDSRLNNGWIYREQVNPSDAGLTVLDYYSQKYPHSTPCQWFERITSGQVLLDGHSCNPHTRLITGQKLAYHRPPWEEPSAPLNFDLLYSDSDVLVVAKPAGLPILPGGGFVEHTLLGQLKQHYPEDTPFPIHRLGRGTSGLVLLARSSFARGFLSEQMRSRQISKIYRALIPKSDLTDHFTINQPIGKIPHPVLGYIFGATPNGKDALSECRVLKRTSETTLVEVKILTGRPHQIRIHLAAIGYPLIGDPLYTMGGIPKIQTPITPEKLPVPGDCGYYLHAYQLTFNLPHRESPLTVTCPPPRELEY
ncbi:pseudouridine synthase, RluA family [Gloeothece citriformis PCC 7424]|uniref:Pseudouridine synthase n=1 Tax=Gloeothece citriformis (strain PCC 7424) TaxID=65393 RepID=B7KI53_GLOC7|nr:RluA family pseudouridine synthase [Gloeothece citriformis]ACK73540.1 pseudouridine synthase, RluA family [Gloeothece citriformis PCC 7424]